MASEQWSSRKILVTESYIFLSLWQLWHNLQRNACLQHLSWSKLSDCIEENCFWSRFCQAVPQGSGGISNDAVKNVNKTEKCSCIKDFDVKDIHTQTHCIDTQDFGELIYAWKIVISGSRLGLNLLFFLGFLHLQVFQVATWVIIWDFCQVQTWKKIQVTPDNSNFPKRMSSKNWAIFV